MSDRAALVKAITELKGFYRVGAIDEGLAVYIGRILMARDAEIEKLKDALAVQAGMLHKAQGRPHGPAV